MNSKSDLRRNMRDKLRQQTASARTAASAQIRHHLHSVLQEAAVVSLFLAQPQEPDIDAFARELQQRSSLVFSPHSRKEGEPFYLLADDWSNVHLNSLGWREPFEYSGGRAVSAGEVDAILLPGLAFDAEGGRLGQGGGWYDRVLVNVPAHVLCVGVCFEFQLLDAVPRETHDRPVSVLVTEQRILYV